MTDYTDLDDVNDLYAQSQLVQNAIAQLNAGGSVTYMTIAGPPFDPNQTPPAPPDPNLNMPSRVTIPDASPQFIAAAKDWLTERNTEINTQLANLGVTNAPAPPTGTQSAAKPPKGLTPIPAAPAPVSAPAVVHTQAPPAQSTGPVPPEKVAPPDV